MNKAEQSAGGIGLRIVTLELFHITNELLLIFWIREYIEQLKRIKICL